MDAEPLDYVGFVNLVLDALDAAGLEYLIGGAVAAWAWGEPRSTLDLDIVVDIPVDAVVRFSQELEKRDMLVPPDVILDALIEDRADIPINAIHMHSGFKTDLYLLHPGNELRRSALNRRQKVDLGPRLGEVYLHSPEDLILYKLQYYTLSEQSKHLRDIAAILKTLTGQLDYEYIGDWAGRLGLITLWTEIRERTENAP